jgi:N,N'-diacetyllegionaminate synthase
MVKKTIIIAEIGPNHNGKIDLAKKLIIAAKRSNADYVKFQTYNTSEVVIRKAKKAKYQMINTGSSENQYNMLKKLEFSRKQFLILYKFCKKNKVKFLTTAFDIQSLLFIKKLNLDYYKIPSGEINNLPYLRLIGSFKKKIILSTGMSYLHEIKKAVKILVSSGTLKRNITLLQCNTEYPTPYKDANLKVMNIYKKNLKMNFGYSDHTLGIEASLAAVALGAKIIEKHFTISRKLKGPDHIASLEPKEFFLMTKSIKNIELALGKEKKFPTTSEKKNIKVARKSIVASCYIKKNELFSEKNITLKRPGDGKSPMLWNKIIGLKAKKNYKIDEKI